MDNKQCAPAGMSGLVHSTDPNRVVSLRRFALTMAAVLEGYSRAEDILDALRRGESAFLVVDYTDRKDDTLTLIREVHREFATVPVLAILPQDADGQTRKDVMASGVRDFMFSPVSVEEFRLRVRNLVRISPPVSNVLRDQAAREGEIREMIGEVLLREAEALYALGQAAEYNDEDTGFHILRVANYSRLIARMIGQSESDQDLICHSSTLHDIGKVGISDAILTKTGPLTAEERRVMQTHTVKGHGMLKDSETAYLLNGAMIAFTHHERWDGTGYPMGLAGASIPLHGRIVCVADVFDALTTRRPYKEPWSLDRAFRLLIDERGKQFDPDLIDAFVNNAPGVEQIYYEYADPSSFVEGTRKQFHRELTYQAG
jgi:response regulator RpfG family c-di-GMP phosphodiesterase